MYWKLSWWYWLVIVIALTLGVFGYEQYYLVAIFLSVVQLIHFIIREKSYTSFPVQVRIGFLIYVLIAYIEPLRFLYWLPVVGTWAMVLVGYCLLARCMSLLPWNRTEPMSRDLLYRTFFSPPVKGTVVQGFPPD